MQLVVRFLEVRSKPLEGNSETSRPIYCIDAETRAQGGALRKTMQNATYIGIPFSMKPSPVTVAVYGQLS
jgi:hypothetical protein